MSITTKPNKYILRFLTEAPCLHGSGPAPHRGRREVYAWHSPACLIHHLQATCSLAVRVLWVSHHSQTPPRPSWNSTQGRSLGPLPLQSQTSRLGSVFQKLPLVHVHSWVCFLSMTACTGRCWHPASMTPVHTMHAKQQVHHSRHILNMRPRKPLPSDIHAAMRGLASSSLEAWLEQLFCSRGECDKSLQGPALFITPLPLPGAPHNSAPSECKGTGCPAHAVFQ